MKALSLMLLIAAGYLAWGCPSPVEKEINELHAATLKLGEEFAPKLEELMQRSNRINVQGRALTAEELEFTDTVATIQDVYATWQDDMQYISTTKTDKTRLEEEKALNGAILNLASTAANLGQMKI